MTNKTPYKSSTVLVIEDNPILQNILCEVLQREKFQPIGCCSGWQALSVSKDIEIPVAILDLNLPDMNGIDVMTHLKQMHPDIKVIINTGHASLETAMAAVNHEAFAYLNKQGDTDELLRRVHQAFHSYFASFSDRLKAEVDKQTRDLEAANLALRKEIEVRRGAEAALRESETTARALLNTPFAAKFLIEPDGTLIDLNDTAAELFKNSPEDMTGKNIWDLLPSQVSAFRKSKMEEMKKNGQLIRFEDVHDHIWSDNIFYPVKDSDGRITRISMLFYDITEKKSLESQLIQAQKMEALGVLVAGIAHEISNPINMMQFNIQLLQDIWKDFLPVLTTRAVNEPLKKYGGLDADYLNDKLDGLIEDTLFGAGRIANIVDYLKNFARKYPSHEKKPIQVEQAVENVIRLCQSSLTRSGIDIDLDLDQHQSMILGNLQNVEQILMNMLLNAVQSYQGQKGRVHIQTRYIKDTNQVKISVTDAGCGIDPAIADKIYDPFVTTRQSQGGIGLGLSITYNLVKSLHGEIYFKTQPGQGTTFHVVFPAV